MHVPSPDFSCGALAVPRRTFLGACSVLALCLAGCRSVGPSTRFAARMLADPGTGDYRPVLRGIQRALLPFEHPRFPSVPPERFERRLLDLFPIDHVEQFSSFQRGLMLFQDIDLYPHLFAPLLRAEQDALPPADAGEARFSSAALERLRSEEQARFLRFRESLRGSPDQFTDLSLAEQRDYLRMWGASGLSARRQFARSARALVMVSAYSMEEMWGAIGYEGPLLEERRAAP